MMANNSKLAYTNEKVAMRGPKKGTKKRCLVCKLTKDKSPGPSGVTNNQMKRWNETTSRTIFELSNIMWEHHSVPQFWQDMLMTLLPKISGNDLSKSRPISLFKNIRKLWAGMVSKRVQSIWHKYNVLHPKQHGFRCLLITYVCLFD